MAIKQKRTLGVSKAKANDDPKPTKASVLRFLKGINKGSTKDKKKDDKPVITLPGKAAALLRLQQAKAETKTLEGEISGLEGELFDGIEEQRLAINEQRRAYIGSVKVTATGKDDAGNDINPGVASYYIQNKYVAFDYYAPSQDEELQAQYEGEATLKHEAVHAIIDAFAPDGDDAEPMSYEDAEAILEERMEIEHGLSLDPAVLACHPDGTPVHPDKIRILQEHFGEFLRSVSKAKPTKTFHEQSNYDPEERRVLDALSSVGLVRRYKAVLKPSGAPRQ